MIREIKRIKKVEHYDKVRIKLASPDIIREWSYGEVNKPDTLNYRTLNRKKKDSFVNAFSVRKKITNVVAVNIRKNVLKELSVIDAG